MDRLFNGTNLGQFRIIQQIDEGGMAKVYKAYQPSMERYVALKVLPAHYAEDPQFIERFNREARTIARLEHQNILPVIDYGEQDGITYLAMRLVEGGTLKDLLSRGKLTTRDTLQIITQVCSALDYAHRQGVIHRDIKPSNVIFDNEGAAYLSDFGIAKVLGASGDLTGTGAAIGTPAYMAPEQAMGGNVDGRTDIYALGIMLYEMVVGRVPYHADTPMAILMAHLREPLPLPRERNAIIPEAIEAVIIKALAKDPDHRYQTANELAQALRQAVYASAPEAVETTLLNLIKEVHTDKKAIEQISTPDLESDPRLMQRLEQQYIDGLSAFWTRDWNKARSFFQAILAIHPAYKDTASRLAEVEKQLRLASLFDQSTAAMEASDWENARELLSQVIALDANYQDAGKRLQTVDRKLELAGLLSQAEQLHQAGQWQAVIKVFDRIHSLEAAFPDPGELLTSARKKLAEEQRLEKIKGIYQRGLHALDEGHWKEAQKLFMQVKAQQPGYAESDQLLQRAIAEQSSLKEKKNERTVQHKKPVTTPDQAMVTVSKKAAVQPKVLRGILLSIGSLTIILLVVVGIIYRDKWMPEIFTFVGTSTLTPPTSVAQQVSQPTETIKQVGESQTAEPGNQVLPVAEGQLILVENFNNLNEKGSLNLNFDGLCNRFAPKGNFVQNGELHLDNEPSQDRLSCRFLTKSNHFLAGELWPMQARLKYALQKASGSSYLWLSLYSDPVEGRILQVACGLKTAINGTVLKVFDVWENRDSQVVRLYNRESLGKYDVWYTARLSLNPDNMAFACLIDNQVIGEYQPDDVQLFQKMPFTRIFETWRDINVTAHAVVDDIYVLQPNKVEASAGQPVAPGSVKFRLRLTTTSDWATFSLESQGEFVNPQTVSTNGVIRDTLLEPRLINLMQEIGRSFAGHSISTIFDLNVQGLPAGDNLTFNLEKGCLGEVEAEVYNIATNKALPIAQFSVDSCNGPVPFGIPVELFLVPNPPQVPEGIPWPVFPPSADVETSKIISQCDDKDPPQLCVRNAKTGDVIQITNSESFNLWRFSRPSWSPDGRQIVYSAAEKENQHFQVYTINADGTGGNRLTGSEIQVNEAVWSPDGQWIAVNQDCRSVRLIRPDNSDSQDPIPPKSEFCINLLRWSPDSQKLAFVDLFNFPEKSPSIWIVNRDGTEMRDIFDLPEKFKVPDNYVAELAWDPTGEQIGIWLNLAGEKRGYLVSINGSHEPQPVDWNYPTWWLPSFWPQWGIAP